MTLPGPDEPVTYDAHIKGLFRPDDRESMGFAFDLWAYADVAENAEAILERLQDGLMPCDSPWPRERVALFERWMQEGTPEN